jgi:hypothetical protein
MKRPKFTSTTSYPLLGSATPCNDTVLRDLVDFFMTSPTSSASTLSSLPKKSSGSMLRATSSLISSAPATSRSTSAISPGASSSTSSSSSSSRSSTSGSASSRSMMSSSISSSSSMAPGRVEASAWASASLRRWARRAAKARRARDGLRLSGGGIEIGAAGAAAALRSGGFCEEKDSC